MNGKDLKKKWFHFQENKEIILSSKQFNISFSRIIHSYS